MYAENRNLTTQDGQFFDITHTFKVGSSTYHVLGLRKDRPTYRNTYYIFNYADDQRESTTQSMSKSSLFKRPTTVSEQARRPKHRPLTAHRATTTPTNEFTTSPTQTRKSTGSHLRARTESPKIVEIDATTFKETFTKAMRTERQLLFASLRKEMNIKKRTLLRTMKKGKEVILQATAEANNKEEIIRLLEEQNNSLAIAFEKSVSTTTASIDTLKQILIETLDTHHNTSQSMEQLQLTLIQTIEQEVQKIILKNEEILQSISTETNAINQLQNTLVQKIENFAITKQHHDDAELNRLFAEQKQALTDAVAQQQQVLSLDLIKQTMVDTIKEQQLLSVNITDNMKNSQQSIDDTIPNILTQHTSIDSHTIDNNNIHSLSRKKSSQYLRTHNQSLSKVVSKKLPDQHLFKVSIRSPEPAHVFATLIIGGIEYSRRLYTLCQRDVIQNDVFNCYIAPPAKNGPYEITLYAKTHKETTYRAAICIRLPGSNISQSITFPLVHQSFEEHQCILIEPLQRLLRQNELVLIHMIVPGAHTVKIRNGEDNIELDVNEYKKEVVKKKIRVRGDVYIIGCWDKKTDSTICVFNMIC
ncbi:unnamed protein product [Rotaria sordida]|uniref:Uncharacterized protein n=1 Tax=Rotaria sordida TaxID=392033 RepID=A0A813RMV0_9BILA|nr:unnamed protein product [Rotaria sordida]CAF3622815.1 unnamed protein product [Rotaria sordida]